jgi:glycosyltransferase involved in cell wall biosynthesis
MPDMRVTVLTSLYPTPVRPFEGVFVEHRWRAMSRRGHDVAVVQPLPLAPPLLARGHRAELRRVPTLAHQHGITVIRPRYLHVPNLPLWNARRFSRAGGTALRKLQPEVVVADYAWPAAAAVPTLHASAIPAVISARGSDLRIAAARPRLERELVRALQSAAGWCGVARHLVVALDRLAGKPGEGRVVFNGIDTELFRIRPRREARERLGISTEATVVLSVGHLIPRKDPLLALDTFATLTDRLEEPLLVLVGDGPLRRQLEDRVLGLGLVERVAFEGEQPQQRIADWYSAADCLLLCSSWEGRPNVVLESLACGLPVLATRTAGSSELLGRFPEMIADSRQPEELASRLLALLHSTPDPGDLRASVRASTWERSAEALERLLQDAVRGRRPL